MDSHRSVAQRSLVMKYLEGRVQVEGTRKLLKILTTYIRQQVLPMFQVASKQAPRETKTNQTFACAVLYHKFFVYVFCCLVLKGMCSLPLSHGKCKCLVLQYLHPGSLKHRYRGGTTVAIRPFLVPMFQAPSAAGLTSKQMCE